MNISIKQAYDIATAIICNDYMGIQNCSDMYKACYLIETNNKLYGKIKLTIFAPYANKKFNMGNNKGHILLQNGDMEYIAHTKHNVGNGFNKFKYNPIRMFERICERQFFELFDIAKSRLNGQLYARNNNQQIHNMIKKLSEKQK